MKRVILNSHQLGKLNEMDIQLMTNGNAANAQSVLSKNKSQLTQAKQTDGKNPNAVLTSPKTDNTKPIQYVQSSPGETPEQAIQNANRDGSVDKTFNNGGSVSVEVNEGIFTKREIEEMRVRNILRNGTKMSKRMFEQRMGIRELTPDEIIADCINETINEIKGNL